MFSVRVEDLTTSDTLPRIVLGSASMCTDAPTEREREMQSGMEREQERGRARVSKRLSVRERKSEI